MLFYARGPTPSAVSYKVNKLGISENVGRSPCRPKYDRQGVGGNCSRVVFYHKNQTSQRDANVNRGNRPQQTLGRLFLKEISIPPIPISVNNTPGQSGHMDYLSSQPESTIYPAQFFTNVFTCNLSYDGEKCLQRKYRHGRHHLCNDFGTLCPWSQQDFGLSALHYASWNGHVRCVEILCINDLGHDGAGLQRSCIDLQSIKGWTPLHLAASDGINGEFYCNLNHQRTRR